MTEDAAAPAAKEKAPSVSDLNSLLESIDKCLSDGDPTMIRQAYDLALVQHPTNVIIKVCSF